MVQKKFKKEPYSFSFSPKTIENLRYYKNTHPNDDKLSQKVENYLKIIIPDMKG